MECLGGGLLVNFSIDDNTLFGLMFSSVGMLLLIAFSGVSIWFVFFSFKFELKSLFSFFSFSFSISFSFPLFFLVHISVDLYFD